LRRGEIVGTADDDAEDVVRRDVGAADLGNAADTGGAVLGLDMVDIGRKRRLGCGGRVDQATQVHAHRGRVGIGK